MSQMEEMQAAGEIMRAEAELRRAMKALVKGYESSFRGLAAAHRLTGEAVAQANQDQHRHWYETIGQLRNDLDELTIIMAKAQQRADSADRAILTLARKAGLSAGIPEPLPYGGVA